MPRLPFKFPEPLNDYSNPGIGGFNSTRENGVTVSFSGLNNKMDSTITNLNPAEQQIT